MTDERKNDPMALIVNDSAIQAKRETADLPDGDPVRAKVEELTAHITSQDAYRDYYKTMRGGICPEDRIFRRHEEVKRFAKIRELILERKHKTVLDLGCLDGWQLLNLAASGIKGVGVDLCRSSLEVGYERAKKWGFDLCFVESSIENFSTENNYPGNSILGMDEDTHPSFVDCGMGKFDAVIISEVLEHVLDPVACMRTAANHLAPGGIVYVSVPATPIPHHGKLEDAREHLRVYSEQDIIDVAKVVGLYRVVDHEILPEQDQGISFANRTISFRRATISISCGHVTGGWTPLQEDSLGGSEEIVVKVAESWTRQGHDVTVYKNGPDGGEEINGVTYLSRDQAPKADQDVLILFKSLEQMHIPANVKIFWTTDLPNPGTGATFLPPTVAEQLDAIVCISEYQRQELLKACPWLNPAKVHQHWVGIEKEEIVSAVAANPKVPKRVLYASSYDRGLAQLLEMWPQVKECVPDAELHVTYGWDFWKRSEAVVSQPIAESMRQERKRIEGLFNQPGVTHLGRIPHTDVLKEFAEAEVWAYPCTGGELCCKTALEAQAAGCEPVVIPTMALAETVQCGFAVSNREDFVAKLIEALQGESAFTNKGVILPSWNDLARWIWMLIESRTSQKTISQTIEQDSTEETKLPERFSIPHCTIEPPTKQLSILMAVQGMPFDGNTDKQKGLGGSETAGLQLSREMVKRGHSVTVFSNLPDKPGKFDGVSYLPIQDFIRYAASTPHDVTIVQRDPGGFNLALRSKLNVLWCHDLGLRRFHNSFRASLWNIDYVAPVSHWHGRQLCDIYGLPPELIAPMRNGIDLDEIGKVMRKKITKDPNAVVFASRPERGLDLLLSSVFPRLLERNPNLTLYVAGYENTTEQMAPFYQHCRQLMANLGPRAKWLGGLKKADLYGLYASARAMLYPSRNFREVSCLTAMEAAACGLPFVSTTLGALPETVGQAEGFARLVEHPGQATPEFIERYVQAVWEVLSDDLLNKRMSDAGRNGATAYSWPDVAREWEDFLLGAIDMRSKDKLRLARHWWRLGDTRGVEQVLPELTPEQISHFAPATTIKDLPRSIPSSAIDTVVNAMCQVIASLKPKTILGLSKQDQLTASTIAQLLGIEAITDHEADVVIGVETLDCSEDPVLHIQLAEERVKPGGHICLVTTLPGTHEDRLHKGMPRRKRWVFDGHDIKELLGKKQDLLTLVIQNGEVSSYDGTPIGWSLHCFKAGGQTGPMNVERRLWLQSPRLSLSGCMITKDAEGLLNRCLKSIESYCDEIVVDDNGSTDSTMEIFHRHSIQPAIGKSPLDIGFDEARNRNINRASGDMILWIDSDEELLDVFNLPKYLRHSIYKGYAVQQHHFSAVPANCFKPDLPVRIFRRIGLDGKETGIRFWGRVHEHPETEINHSVGDTVVLFDVHIGHDGYLTESGRRKRFDRNIKLMHWDRATYPNRVLGKFLMLRDWIHLGRYEAEKHNMLTPEAMQYLEAAVRSFQDNFLGVTHQMATDGLMYYNEALQLLGRGFEVQVVLKVGTLDGSSRELVYNGRVASRQDLEKLVGGSVKELASVWEGEYL